MLDVAAWRAAGSMAGCAGHRIFHVDSFHVDSAPGDAERPAILLIHGFPTSSWDWTGVWPDLSRDHRLVAPDLLGFGWSAKPRRHRYSIMEQADICEDLVRHLGLRRFHVLAHDYGDTVAQEMLARQNARPAAERQWLSVCFLNGGLFPETHRARPVQKLLAGPLGPLLSAVLGKRSFARSFSAVFGPETKPSAAEIDAFWSLISHDGGRIVFHKLIGYMAERRAQRERWLGALREACCPVQLINGSADPVSGAHMVARYRELVRADDAITELPRIGHYPQVEAPAAVVAAYRAFLAGSATDRRRSPP